MKNINKNNLNVILTILDNDGCLVVNNCFCEINKSSTANANKVIKNGQGIETEETTLVFHDLIWDSNSDGYELSCKMRDQETFEVIMIYNSSEGTIESVAFSASVKDIGPDTPIEDELITERLVLNVLGTRSADVEF